MDLRTSAAVTLIPTLVTTSADEDEKVDNEDVNNWRPPSCPTATEDDEDGYGGGDEVDVDLNADDTNDLCGYEPREIKIVPLLERDVISCDTNDDVTANDDDNDKSDDDDEYKKIFSRPIAGLKLSFDEAPEFVVRLKAYNEVNVGNAVTFIAKFRAVPTPTIKWYKDEEEVRPTLRHHLEYTPASSNEGTIRLTIDDVRSADEGAYKVKVENQEGVASTTGYLSVSDGKKPPSKKNSRSSKLSNVSTPPFLRPITEQRSMEESEELELSRQPPSPLQDFIDSIRRSAKSKHPPIYYGTSAEIFAIQTDDDVSPDQNDDNDSGAEDDDDVFDIAGTPTSSDDRLELLTGSIDDDVCLDDVNEASFSPVADSDTFYTEQSELPVDSTVSCQCFSAISDSPSADAMHTSTLSKRRLGAMQLQHRLAIDLPDYLPSTTLEQSHQLSTSQQSAPDAETTTQWNDSAAGRNASAEQCISRLSNTAVQTPAKKLSVLSRLFQAAQEFLLMIMDCPKVGFYLFFIAVSTALANTFEVQPIWLVITVAIISVVSFLFVELQSSLCRPSSSPPSSDGPLLARRL